MPKTIGAADRVRRSGCPPDVRCWAGDLLQGLAAVECHFSAGGAAAVPAGLLRDLVVITAALAYRTRVETHADKTAVFGALHSTWQPPPLPELDQILADALSTLFAEGDSGLKGSADASIGPDVKQAREKGPGRL